MPLYGADDRGSRSIYGKLFNPSQECAGLGSEHSLDPILPPAKRSDTVQSFSSPNEPFLRYEKVDLNNNHTPIHGPAQTSGGSVEGPKPAIRTGFWSNSSKLIPHLAACAITAAVVQLSFRNQYWVSPSEALCE